MPCPTPTEGGKKDVSKMYAQQDGSPRRPVRLPIAPEDRLQKQMRPSWLLKELQSEREMDEEALGVVDPDLDGLTHGRVNGRALVESHHIPWR